MKQMPELKVEAVPTDELVMYKNNANIHSHEQIDQIAASIEEFGFSSPILAWHNDNGKAEIVAGHGRFMAAKKIGLEELPVIFIDHLTDEQRRAFGLVENQLTRLSEFDLGMLEVELESIVNIDMEQFDFSIDIPEVGEITNSSQEIDVENFNDDKFEHECPRCGFKFNE